MRNDEVFFFPSPCFNPPTQHFTSPAPCRIKETCILQIIAKSGRNDEFWCISFRIQNLGMGGGGGK